METQKILLKDENGEEVEFYLYISMIGSLMYLTTSRPDIMFALCACGRYQVNPNVSHLHAVIRIFRYLKGQLKLGLWYPKDSPFDLVAYTNSDYAGASLDRKSATGGCQFLGSRLISWQCTDDLPNTTIFEELKRMRFSSTMVSIIIYLATNQKFNFSKYVFESMAKNLDNAGKFLMYPSSLGTSSCSGPKRQDTIGDTIARTRFENVSKTSNDSLLAGVNIPRSDKDRLKLNELMEFCTKLQQRVLELENTMIAQD
ncbi:hypothetical protein Tco_0933153 [Tanacetum coccineum]